MSMLHETKPKKKYISGYVKYMNPIEKSFSHWIYLCKAGNTHVQMVIYFRQYFYSFDYSIHLTNYDVSTHCI